MAIYVTDKHPTFEVGKIEDQVKGGNKHSENAVVVSEKNGVVTFRTKDTNLYWNSKNISKEEVTKEFSGKSFVVALRDDRQNGWCQGPFKNWSYTKVMVHNAGLGDHPVDKNGKRVIMKPEDTVLFIEWRPLPIIGDLDNKLDDERYHVLTNLRKG